MEGGATAIGKGKTDQQPAAIHKIDLAIKSQDGDEYYYRVARNKKILYLFLNYCKEKNIEYKAACFLCDGKRINPMWTPVKLDLKDGDMIDVMMHQSGGGYSGNMEA